MRRALVLFAFILMASATALPFAATTNAAGPEWVVVNPGDTLLSIATRYGIPLDRLIRANNLPNENFVFNGQRLLIPDALMTFPDQPQQPAQVVAAVPSQPVNVVFYTVSPGDSLASIAARYGVSVAGIAQANHLTNSNFVWYGQRLLIPGTSQVNPVPQPILAPVPAPVQPAAPAPPDAPITGKWIDVNVRNQTATAYEGTVPVKTISVSTGTAYHPTVLGTFKILTKYPAVRMTGGTPGVDYYDLPNVPWTMFFYQGFALHGTYWHHNFGHPMSHGCVNLPTDEAKWFYDWAPVGTPVITHV